MANLVLFSVWFRGAHFEPPIVDAPEGFAASENEPRSVDVERQDARAREVGISLQNDAGRCPLFCGRKILI
jgi:hypothetical protein